MIKLTTNQGTNAMAILAAIYEFGGSAIPAAHHEVFSYVMSGVLILVLWMTKGSHPEDGVPIEEPEFHSEAPPDTRQERIQDVIRRGQRK